MALRKCNECGHEVSTKAASCPKCGAVRKKNVGCLGCLGAGFVIFVILAIVGSVVDMDSSRPTTSSPASNSNRRTTAHTPKKPTKDTFEEGQTVSTGYTSYVVWRSWWSDRLSTNEFLNESPDARYLFLELTVRNDDNKPRTVPPFRLIDERGAEYEADDRSWGVEGSIGIFESLNPSVQKQGLIVFDVPTNRQYRLKVSGGWWSGKSAFIRLSPTEGR